jgi:phytoene dehydrogenase-like protein
MRIIVIGSGMSGLTSAAYLQQAGHDVTIYEQFPTPGGVTATLKKDGFLIYVPSLHSPQLAPSGKHAMTIYTVTPDRLAESSWTDRREELADKLVSEAERIIPGLHEHILTRVILTPDDFRQRTHVQHHSFGGIPPVIGNHPPPHRTPIEGLWFIGAQSESSGGVMKVMDGARKVTRKILSLCP